MTMQDQLPCLAPGTGKSKAKNDVIQAKFKQLHEQCTGDPLLSGSLLKVTPKLFLQDAIHPLDFLLLAKL